MIGPRVLRSYTFRSTFSFEKLYLELCKLASNPSHKLTSDICFPTILLRALPTVAFVAGPTDTITQTL